MHLCGRRPNTSRTWSTPPECGLGCASNKRHTPFASPRRSSSSPPFLLGLSAVKSSPSSSMTAIPPVIQLERPGSPWPSSSALTLRIECHLVCQPPRCALPHALPVPRSWVHVSLSTPTPTDLLPSCLRLLLRHRRVLLPLACLLALPLPIDVPRHVLLGHPWRSGLTAILGKEWEARVPCRSSISSR